MRHYADPEFWRYYRALPDDIRELADKNFELLKANPKHPSLRFKKLKGTSNLWSARVGIEYRAVAAQCDDGIQWFWIGTHADYERLLSQ